MITYINLTSAELPGVFSVPPWFFDNVARADRARQVVTPQIYFFDVLFDNRESNYKYENGETKILY